MSIKGIGERFGKAEYLVERSTLLSIFSEFWHDNIHIDKFNIYSVYEK